MDDSNDGINFWPAFSDSMLAVILVLLLVIGAVYLSLGEQIKKAQDCESDFANGVHAFQEGKQNKWVVLTRGSHQKLFTLQQDPHDSLLLHIAFDDSALGFRECDDKLGAAGMEALRAIAAEIRKQSRSIVEIQILGNADKRRITGCSTYKNNLRLASARADSVFQYLQESGISPFEVAMSAVSYGEYFPASRHVGEAYSEQKWAEANSSPSLMQENRRVELIIRYGTNMLGCQIAK